MLEDSSKVLEDSARGGFYLSIGQILSGLISALSLIIIARVLGADNYGIFTLSTVVPSLFIMVVDPGINTGLVRFSASLRTNTNQKRLGKLLLHAMYIKIFLSCIAFLLCYVLSDIFAVYLLNRPEIGYLIRIASGLIIFQTIFLTLNSIFIGFNKTEYNTLTTVLQAIGKASITPALVILGLSLSGAIIGYVSSFALAIILGAILFSRKVYKMLNGSNGDSESLVSNTKMLIRYGLPLYVATLISGLALQYRSIILSFFAYNYEIGNLQAAFNANVIVGSISAPISTILLPAFSRIKGKETIRNFFNISIKYTSIVVLFFVILLILHAEEFITIFYGEGYELASNYLVLYCTIFFLTGLGSNTLGSFFNGLGHTYVNLKIALINSFVLLFLAPILTNILGINGMILAIIGSTIAGLLFGLYNAKIKYGITINTGALVKIYFVSLLPALLVFVLKAFLPFSFIINTVVAASTYLLLYLLALPLFGVINQKELQMIRNIVKKVKLLDLFVSPILAFEQRILNLI